MILKHCKEVGYQVKSQPLYSHGIISNSSHEDSEVGSVAGDGSKGDEEDGMDSEKEVRSEVNSAANDTSQTVSVSPPTPNSGPDEVELEPQHGKKTPLGLCMRMVN